MTHEVYIVDIATLTPPRHRSDEIVARFYAQPGITRDVATFAARAGRNVGIRTRASILDLDALPQKRLVSERHTPKLWCHALLDALTPIVAPEHIGYFGVSYNASSHVDVLPNLACQVACERGFGLCAPPQELSHYGCASSVLQVASAVEFCRRTNAAAIVIALEQCTWAMNPIGERRDDDFAASLRSHLLFGDGAAAVLLVPAPMATAFASALRIVDVTTGFRPGRTLGMRDGRFLVGDDVKETMPPLVAAECVLPALRRHGLVPADVPAWAIHQGGLPVLARFTEPSILGLTDTQIADSADTFRELGNLSAASCLFALKRQFDRPLDKRSLGMTIAFGAGYYFGCFLYEKCNPSAEPPRTRRPGAAGRSQTGVLARAKAHGRSPHTRACRRSRLGTRHATREARPARPARTKPRR